MSQIADVAEAIVVALNLQTFSPVFTATRNYKPEFDLQEKDLRVTVVPNALISSLLSRAESQSDVRIDIGVQKKVSGQVTNAEIDTLIDLVEQIAIFIRTERKFSTSFWLSTENDPIYSQEHLKDMHQFTSVLTATLRLVDA